MQSDAQLRFTEDLHKLVSYFAREYQLSYAQMIGVMKLMSDQLSEECRKDKEGSGYGPRLPGGE